MIEQNKKVKKRSGSIVDFDQVKIVIAIEKAITATINKDEKTKFHYNVNLDVNESNTFDVATDIANKVLYKLGDFNTVDIEEIQDKIEFELMDCFPEVGKQFIIYREKHKELRDKKKNPDPNAIGDYMFAAKYSLFVDSLGRREVFSEIVDRNFNMHARKFPHIIEILKKAYKFVYSKKLMPAMRSMQFAGKAIEKDNARIFNCSFTLVNRIKVFSEIFYLLLCGCGVGYSVQLQHIKYLPELAPRPKSYKVKHYTVPDTIEGWADSIYELVMSYVEGYWVEFDYSKIRPKGTKLKTSGGVAPGHLPLRRCIEFCREILDKARGRKLNSLECSDIICRISEAVLAGGIRRASLIAIFTYEDDSMFYAKSYPNFDPDPINGLNQFRQMANFTAGLIRKEVKKEQFDRIIKTANEGFGEPAFAFLDDPRYGYNPCGEAGLNPVYDEEITDPTNSDNGSIEINARGVTELDIEVFQTKEIDPELTGFQFCNLCDIICTYIETEEEFYEVAEAAAVIGTCQAAYTDFKYLTNVTKKITDREALLGIGLNGIQDNRKIIFKERVLKKAAKIAIEVNRKIAKLIGINPAARVTLVKPGGNSSLALGAIASGAHDHHSDKYLRRITATPGDPVAEFFLKHNPHMVEHKPNGDYALIFPVKAPEGVPTVKTRKALDFMEDVMYIYENWVAPGLACDKYSPGLSHNVSCSVTVRDEEKEDVLDFVWDNRDRISAMTFVPYFLDKKFPYAPREEVVSEEDHVKYNNLIANYRRVPWEEFTDDLTESENRTLDPACAGGFCEM